MNKIFLNELDDILKKYKQDLSSNDILLLLNNDNLYNLITKIFEDINIDELDSLEIQKSNTCSLTKKILFKYVCINSKSFDNYSGPLEKYYKEVNAKEILKPDIQKELSYEHQILKETVTLYSNIIISQYFHLIKEVLNKYNQNRFDKDALVEYVIRQFEKAIKDNKFINNDDSVIALVKNTVNDIFTCKLKIKPIESFDINKYKSNYKMTKEEIDNLYDELTKEESKRRKLKQYLAEHNLKLVVSIAKTFQNRGLELNDLIQEGNIGLLDSIDRYDASKGTILTTYSTWWIRQAILRSLVEKGTCIRLPLHFNEKYTNYKYLINQYEKIYGKIPNYEYLASKMNTSIDDIKKIEKFSTQPISLSEPIGEMEHGIQAEVGDTVEDEKINIEKDVTDDYINKNLLSALDELNSKFKSILLMRFGFQIKEPFIFTYNSRMILLSSDIVSNNDILNYLNNIGYEKYIEEINKNNYELVYIYLNGDEMTLEEISHVFGVTRERIRQIEASALKKLELKKNLNIYK